jgi:hypothetical protein
MLQCCLHRITCGCRERATQPEGRRLVIVALSANVLDSDVAQCVEAGMDGHLGKPLRSDSISQLRRYITAAATTNHNHRGSSGALSSLAAAGS